VNRALEEVDKEQPGKWLPRSEGRAGRSGALEGEVAEASTGTTAVIGQRRPRIMFSMGT
jgi:hypothetical protein